MMMQPELLYQPSWPFHSLMTTPHDQIGPYSDPEGSFWFTTSDHFLFTDEFVEYPMEKVGVDDMGDIEQISGAELEDMCRWLSEGESEGSFPSRQLWSPQPTKSSGVSMFIPGDDVEIDSQLSLKHQLGAYGEAIEMDHMELAEVISRCIIEKVNPIGETLERLAFHLFQSAEKREEEYLKQESRKNFEAAFQAFYQSFPYGKFAHFTANLAILEAMPENIQTVHIVDFDVREGVQWAPMIESIAWLQKKLRITLVKSWEDLYGETKRRLCDHARSSGLSLKVEEVGIEDLARERTKMKSSGESEWLAFNCMVGLPHMGKGRKRSHAIEFLRVAKEILANCGSGEGIIVIGDGDAGERLKRCSRYGSFFDGYTHHYQALCESMEWNFPPCLAEARISMESLFVAPSVSSLSWLEKWEEMREGSDLQADMGFKGVSLTKENLMEAKEMVREGESLYAIRLGGQNENEMVLEWGGTPLVRVSAWR